MAKSCHFGKKQPNGRPKITPCNVQLEFRHQVGPAVCRRTQLVFMVLAADYGEMPDTLLQQIFSSCNLNVRSRLRCQQVCRSWKECLSCRRPTGRNCLWAKRIEINLSYGARQSTRLLIDYTESFSLQSAAITLGIDDCFMSWLARQASNFQRISIRYNSSDFDWRLPTLIQTLERVEASRPELELLDLDHGPSGKAALVASRLA